MSILDEQRVVASTAPGPARRAVPAATLARLGVAALAVAVIVFQQLYRTPWGLPGHRGIFWLTSLIAARWALDRTGSATAVAVTSGGILLGFDPTLSIHVLPLMAAGVLIDAVAAVPLVRRLPWLMIVLAPLIHLVNIVNPFVHNLEVAPLGVVLNGMWFYIRGHLEWGVGAGFLGTGLGLGARRGLRVLRRRGTTDPATAA